MELNDMQCDCCGHRWLMHPYNFHGCPRCNPNAERDARRIRTEYKRRNPQMFNRTPITPHAQAQLNYYDRQLARSPAEIVQPIAALVISLINYWRS